MMQLRKRTLFLCMTIALLAGHGVAQSRKVYPVDEATKDRSFKVFRDRLLTAARQKDKEFILSILDPKIQLSFGGHSGVKDFKEMWKIDKPNSQFWGALTTILGMGGAFTTIDGHKEFVAPYVTSQWPDSPDLDVFEYVAVIGTNVKLRAAPGVKAPVVASLTYDILKLEGNNKSGESVRKDGFKWIKVSTGTGQQGFIADKYVRSPIDYRAFFRKVNGSWRMTSFIAGD